MTLNLKAKIYNDENAARKHLESIQWPEGPICPHCGAINEATLLEGKSTRPGVYKCRPCQKPFSVTVGTVFERSKIPLTKWLLATELLTSSKKGISAHQLHRMLGVTYKTAWFLAHRVREAMAPAAGSEPPLGGEGQVRYVGANATNPPAAPKMRALALALVACLLGGEECAADQTLAQEHLRGRDRGIHRFYRTKLSLSRNDLSNVEDKPSHVRIRSSERKCIVDASANAHDDCLSSRDCNIEISSRNIVGHVQYFLFAGHYSGAPSCRGVDWSAQFFAYGFLPSPLWDHGTPEVGSGIYTRGHRGAGSSVFALEPHNESDSICIYCDTRRFYMSGKVYPWSMGGNKIISGNGEFGLNSLNLNLGADSKPLSLRPKADRRDSQNDSEERHRVVRTSVSNPDGTIVDKAANERLGTAIYLLLGFGALFFAHRAFMERNNSFGWFCATLGCILLFGAVIGN